MTADQCHVATRIFSCSTLAWFVGGIAMWPNEPTAPTWYLTAFFIGAVLSIVFCYAWLIKREG